MESSRKILLVDGDAWNLSVLGHALEQGGFRVVRCGNGEAVPGVCMEERPDLVILEMGLPGQPGTEVCRVVRTHPVLSHTPIIFLTARDAETDKLAGLAAGANDYIVKPVSVPELLARIQVHTRNGQPHNGLLRIGILELDSWRHRVRLNGSEVSLTELEFRLLEYLMKNPGIVFSRERLLEAVWPARERSRARTVDVHVARLRNKIENCHSRPVFFRSVRGIGYSLEIEA